VTCVGTGCTPGSQQLQGEYIRGGQRSRAELRRARVGTSLPAVGRVRAELTLEAGYFARNARDHDELLDELLALPNVRVDERVETRAVDAQRQLARAGHHRLPPVDLIIAALADTHGLGVLHYDVDYEIVSEKTDLRFESVWLVPRGSI
jgi:predicted nucleic acid-binding protein